MKVDEAVVTRLADLAKLKFDEESKGKIIEDLNKIFTFIEQLNELDTDGVEPLTYITDEMNVLREDEVKHVITHADALKNVPKKDSDYIKVPKVLNKGDHDE
jgi:aspartyl-tRNA(Asn)/glutamyl-tRNA(Gln) amidotransferase subunit C